MKKRVIKQLIGAGLLALALLGSFSMIQSVQDLETASASTQVEVQMDEAISVLP